MPIAPARQRHTEVSGVATPRSFPSFSGYSSPFMPTFAQTLDLVDDAERIAEYDRYHAHVWPEVVAGLHTIGITSMHLFRTGTRLFMVYEAPASFNPARDYQRYADDPRCQAWDDLMQTFQRPIPTAREGEWWTPMGLLFALEHPAP
jgi:L-rhamnose mutarotase